jgi:hypothetical protein
MTANVDEIGRALARRRRVMMIRQAKRNVSLRQQPENVGPIPARMAEFKAVTSCFRKKLEKRCEPFGISLEMRWQLKQHRPSFGTQHFQPLFDQGELLTEFSESRFQWVMNLEAFHAKTQSSPVCSRQFFTVSRLGVR